MTPQALLRELNKRFEGDTTLTLADVIDVLEQEIVEKVLARTRGKSTDTESANRRGVEGDEPVAPAPDTAVAS